MVAEFSQITLNDPAPKFWPQTLGFCLETIQNVLGLLSGTRIHSYSGESYQQRGIRVL
jgi:hypothetical protein